MPAGVLIALDQPGTRAGRIGSGVLKCMTTAFGRVAVAGLKDLMTASWLSVRLSPRIADAARPLPRAVRSRCVSSRYCSPLDSLAATLPRYGQ